MRYLLGEFVALHVDNCDVWHFQQYFREELFSFNLVIGDIEGTDGRTGQQANDIIKTSPAYSIALQLQIGQVCQFVQPLYFFDQVIAQVEISKPSERVQALDPADHIFLEVEASQVDQVLQAFNLPKRVSLHI